jgi:hypothetical protein
MDTTTLLYLALLGAAISALTEGIKRALPKEQHHYLPLIPLLLGAIGGPLTGLTPATTIGAAVVWGVLAGAFSGQAYEAVGKLIPKKEETP